MVTWPGAAYAVLPLVVLIHLTILAGAALLLSLANVHFADVRSIMDALVTVGFVLTPIFYTTEAVRRAFADSPVALGWMKPLYFTNPFVGLTEAYRDIMIYGQVPALEVLAWPAAAGLALLGLGLVVYRRQSPTLGDIV